MGRFAPRHAAIVQQWLERLPLLMSDCSKCNDGAPPFFPSFWNELPPNWTHYGKYMSRSFYLLSILLIFQHKSPLAFRIVWGWWARTTKLPCSFSFHSEPLQRFCLRIKAWLNHWAGREGFSTDFRHLRVRKATLFVINKMCQLFV